MSTIAGGDADKIQPHLSPRVMIGIVAGWIVAMVLMHHPMIFSGLGRMQADLGDSRLNNLFLEHTYQWITFNPKDSNFWNPRFFYPQTNTAAYSDLMLGFAPFYWCWRLIGLQPDTAFQFWMFTGTTLNFALVIIWLRACCKTKWLGAIIGAVFFAAAGSRATQLGHQQLQWQLYPMLALIAVYQIAAITNPTARRWWILLGACLVCQFWGGFYNAWFLMLAFGIAVMLSLSHRQTRKRMVVIFRRDLSIIFAVVIAVPVLIGPAVFHYLAVIKDVGGHRYQEVYVRLAHPDSWIFPGPFSIERAVVSRWWQFPDEKLERAVAIGVVTSCMAIVGLWLCRRRPGVVLLALTGAIFVCLGTLIGGRFALWWIAFNAIPGAEAIRAPARIGLMLAIPASAGLAYFIDYFWNRRLVLVMLGVTACLFEQASNLPSYDKQETRNRITAITAVLPRDAKYFFYTGNTADQGEYAHIDAMWASLQAGVPTLNGYSGSTPIGWDMVDAIVQPSDPTNHQQQLQGAIDKWASIWAIDPAKVVWLQADHLDHVCVTHQPDAVATLR